MGQPPIVREIVPVSDNYNRSELRAIEVELRDFYRRRNPKSWKTDLKIDRGIFESDDDEKGPLGKIFRRNRRSQAISLLYNAIHAEQVRRAKQLTPVSDTSTVLEEYPLREPYSRVKLVRDSGGQVRYLVSEPELFDIERLRMEELKELLTDELKVDPRRLGSNEKTERYLRQQIHRTVTTYKIPLADESLDKITYFILRDFIYFGPIDPLMNDPRIEDISCNGYALPIYVWHQKHESIPTNITFHTPEELDRFVTKLTYMTGRAISIAQPVLDATLPDQSRVQVTYEKEVTRRGSSFTIRKFRERPFTVSDLVRLGTISTEMAAWFWSVIEKRSSILVVGGTASGKTVSINMLSMFIKPTAKIVSIEDTAELQLAHENWLPSIARTGFGTSGKVAEITLFDLLKSAMRQRPEYIIVGEVRGAEAYTLAQAIATGHGSLSTIHADSVEAAIHRLESEPMNIPRALITTIDVICVQARVQVENKPVRRMISVTEIVGLDPNSKELLTNEVFKWDPVSDTFRFSGRSYLLEKLMARHGLGYQETMQEAAKRRQLLDWMVRSGVNDYKDVVELIRTYYLNSSDLLRKVETTITER